MITDRTAAFCLIDQRTFECDWATLVSLAAHKSTNKIELFYFLGTGWLDRSFSGISVSEDRVAKWWGRSDWRDLEGMNGRERAHLFCDRFRKELGYAFAFPWPIYARGAKGPVMYHMIHGSDHPEAHRLMVRAYKTATNAEEPSELRQLVLDLDAPA